jgi:hypothetical protein
MISARAVWKHRRLAWKYRGLLISRKQVLAGVIAGISITVALARQRPALPPARLVS